MTQRQSPTRMIGREPLSIDEVLRIARGAAVPALDPDPAFRDRLRRSAEHVRRSVERGDRVYGVTTGFGDSCENEVGEEEATAMAANLVRFHGCGTGAPLEDVESAAVVVVRLATLAGGHSGVRVELLERLCALLARGILPVIPSEGSVGASGDLTPLSYLAAVVMGEREVRFRGEVVPAGRALAAAGLAPLPLQPKESLALMNGTSVMAALGCLAFDRARRLARASATVTAMASDVLLGEPGHFDARIFAWKPHPGQALCARWIREHLEGGPGARPPGARVQDRYSIRCAPHVIGVLLDALPSMRRTLEIEVNGASDNPLVDPDTGDVLHGGNFYGGHVAFAMDGLKAAVASIADLLDRQVALVCNPATSNGLPANLVGRTGPDRHAHHAFKAMQISASALAAEALKLTMPAASFSRSTECHNQDKVSMGTIAARDALRVLELSERVTAIGLLVACQAADLRGPATCRPRTREVLAAVREAVPPVDADRAMDVDIREVIARLDDGRIPVGEAGEP
jgi:histidine ammonia-lyase